MNKVILVGRIVSEIEVITTKSNITYTRFNVAVNRRTSNNDITDFIPVVAWRGTATFLANNTTKGSKILVEGSLFNNRFVNAQGQNVNSYEVNVENVELLETKSQLESRKNNSFSDKNNMNYSSNQDNTTNNVTFAPTNSYENPTSIPSEEEEEDWDLDSFI